MTPGLHSVVSIGTVLIVFFGYYYFAKAGLFRLSHFFASRFPRWGRGRPVLQSSAIYEIVLVVASHVVLVIGLYALAGSLGFSVPGLLVSDLTLLLLPLGAVLGVAQMTASIYICQLIITGIAATQRRAAAAKPSGRARPAMASQISPELWTDYSRAGWMRHHLVAESTIPRALSVLLTTTQVACEEVVFRGIIPAVLPFAGLWISGALFVVMQMFFMPNWRSAMFPVVGAVLMAVTHGFLFSHIPELWPLIVAHAVSFFAASKR